MRKFVAIAYNEVLLNSKRVAPYALIVLFIGVAVLGWARGPAIALGWATNSDFYIARGLKAFSFLFGVPIFNAMIMGNAVSTDFRLGMDPLTFSKPLNRAQYLFGKFFGNFLVLVCCTAAFPLTQMALQRFRPSGMVVQPFKVLPYFTHFFFFVVITQLAFAAFFFMVGALTRNNKIVYMLAIGFYPVCIASMLFVVSGRGKILLDPFLLNSGPSKNGFGSSADYLNQYVYSYTPDMILNRVGLILIAVACLTWLYVRFTATDRSKQPALAELSFVLSTATESVTYESDQIRRPQLPRHEKGVPKKLAKLKNPFRSPFFAIFQNEVRLNSRRIAPYMLMLFAVFNAVLWSVGLGATYYGKEVIAKYGRLWAINSDYYIEHDFSGFAMGIFGLPIFAALIMAEPVRRDFRLQIDSLIFSKPVSRAQYLLGKFFGSFFVLVCCQASFAATLILLQVFHTSEMVVLPFRFLPYIKHFIMIVVITYALFAAVYFTVGTLTRNPKIVYGLAIAYYPLIISYGIFFLKYLPPQWRVILSPLMLREVEFQTRGQSPEWVDRLVVGYSPIMIANRAVVILASAVCLLIVCRRFRTAEPPVKPENFSCLNLSADREVLYFDPPIVQRIPDHAASSEERVLVEKTDEKATAVPSVIGTNSGLRANLAKLTAAIGVEFRLLRAERSLIVVMPLAIFLSILEVAFYNIQADISLSASYASNTATSLLIFLIGIAVFYTGEAMHRDREVRIEPFLWSTPIPNTVLLLSKFLSTLLLLFGLIVSVGVAAAAIQIVRHHTPIDLNAYLKIYGLILLPSAFILSSISLMANVALRNKYVFYVVSVGTAAGLFYLYSNGYNHWLYNPVMYRLWTYSEVVGAAQTFLFYRLCWLMIAIICLALAHLFFERRSRRKVNLPLPFALR